MPRAPILDRELFYDTLRDGSIRLLDWCLVNTSLGAMVEPRQLGLGRDRSTNIDAKDASFSRLTPLDEDKFVSLFNTGGQQVPIDYSA